MPGAAPRTRFLKQLWLCPRQASESDAATVIRSRESWAPSTFELELSSFEFGKDGLARQSSPQSPLSMVGLGSQFGLRANESPAQTKPGRGFQPA
jgi:hypothetical protein